MIKFLLIKTCITHNTGAQDPVAQDPVAQVPVAQDPVAQDPEAPELLPRFRRPRILRLRNFCPGSGATGTLYFTRFRRHRNFGPRFRSHRNFVPGSGATGTLSQDPVAQVPEPPELWPQVPVAPEPRKIHCFINEILVNDQVFVNKALYYP